MLTTFRQTTLLTTFLLLSFFGFNQVLQATSLNLNAGGMIYDVAYNDYFDAYMVVGDFSTINGQTRNNLAFIDRQTMTVLNDSPISSIDGEIRTIEHFSRELVVAGGPFPAIIGYRYSFFIGGNFTNVNGQSHPGIARFNATHNFSAPPFDGTAGYVLNTWDPGFELLSGPGFQDGVNDFYLEGDTIYAAGSFYMFNGSLSYQNNANFIGFKIMGSPPDNGYIGTFNHVAGNEDYSNSGPVYNVEKFGDDFYLCGDAFLRRYSFTGTEDVSYAPNICGTGGAMWDVAISPGASDTTVYGMAQYAAGTDKHEYTIDDATILSGPFCGAGTPTIAYSGSVQEAEVLGDKAIMLGGTTIDFYDRTQSTPVSSSATFTLNSNWYNWSGGSQVNRLADQKLTAVGHHVFVSGDQLTSVNGQSRIGFAVICDAPQGAKEWDDFDATACPGNINTYSVEQNDFADGYRWVYTGTGAQYRITGSGDAFQPLSTVTLIDQSAYSIDILFPDVAESATLDVESFVICNTSSYEYSAPLSGAIEVFPSPNISMADTLAITCMIDTVDIVVQSSSMNVNYEIDYNLSNVMNDTVQITKDDIGIFEGNYIGTVTGITSGCVSKDTTWFHIDTLGTPIDPMILTASPSTWTCGTASMTLTSNIPDATVTWAESSDPATTYPDPYTITSPGSGSFIVYATYNASGCSVQAGYAINVDQQTVDGTLQGYPNFGMVTIIDSLSCANPTLSLTCDVTGPDAPDGVVEWLDGGVPTGTTVLNLTEADTVGMDAFNVKIYTFRTTNTVSGCELDFNVAVQFNFDPPVVIPHGVTEALNCSQSSLDITHVASPGTVIEGWLDAMGTQTGSNTINVSTVGDYYFQVEDVATGCISTDTVTVIQDNGLLIDLIEDTLICPNQIVSVTALPVNNMEVPTYDWSTGETTPTIDVEGGVDTEVSVIITTPSGCIGYDTLDVLITAPIQIETTASAGCADGVIQIDNVTGGNGSYSYSLDGSTWQTETSFLGLSIGTHTVYVQDDLGCVYSFVDTIEAGTSTLDVNFLASTYNESGDTIALVNFSGFTGFDSYDWTLPVEASVISETDSLVILTIPTGGWYDVTLTGNLDTCTYTITKPVYFGDEVPDFTEDYDTLGIQSISVFDNPTSGTFNVNVEFGISQNYSIVVTNLQGQPVSGMNTMGVGDIISHSFTFPLGSPTGTYIVHIIADYDAQQQMIILQ